MQTKINMPMLCLIERDVNGKGNHQKMCALVFKSFNN